jgi:large subunit ribosomal protein L31
MKADIHPDYHFVSVTLADGTTYRTRSTMKAETYTSDVDSSNHPFYTGKKTLVDTAGRVEKFMRRYGKPAPAAEPAADATPEAAEG